MNTRQIEKRAEFLRQQLGGLIFAFPIDEEDPYSKFAVVVYTGDGFRAFPEPLDVSEAAAGIASIIEGLEEGGVCKPATGNGTQTYTMMYNKGNHFRRRVAMQRTNIYLSEDQLRLLKHLSAAENKSVSDLVRQAVDEFLRGRLKESSNWQAEMDALVKRVRSRVGADISEEEIEADVRVAKKEAREARNEGRH